MRKLAIAFALAFFASTFAFIATPASAQPMHHRCGRGYHWVQGHHNRMGHWVPGHCAPWR